MVCKEWRHKVKCAWRCLAPNEANKWDLVLQESKLSWSFNDRKRLDTPFQGHPATSCPKRSKLGSKFLGHTGYSWCHTAQVALILGERLYGAHFSCFVERRVSIKDDKELEAVASVQGNQVSSHQQ